jgi:hypothetical protein
MKKSIQGQQLNEFSKDNLMLLKGQRYLNALILETKTNHMKAPENIAYFYKTLAAIDAAHAKTWADSKENLNKWRKEADIKKEREREIHDKKYKETKNRLESKLNSELSQVSNLAERNMFEYFEKSGKFSKFMEIRNKTLNYEI